MSTSNTPSDRLRSTTMAFASPAREMVPASHYALFVAIAFLGCFLDLYSKHVVFDWRGLPGEQPIWWLWEGYAGIETSLNRGSLGGLELGGPETSVIILAIISTLALIGLMIWFVWGKLGIHRSMTIALACITAGILGNLYDRLGLWSLGPDGAPTIRAVRDWIRLSAGSWVWPNFNVADSLLVCSTIWILWSTYRASPSVDPAENRSHGELSS